MINGDLVFMAGDIRDMSGRLTIYPNEVIDGSHETLKHQAVIDGEYDILEEALNNQTPSIDIVGYEELHNFIYNNTISLLDEKYEMNAGENLDTNEFFGIVEDIITGLEIELGTLCPENASLYNSIVVNTLEKYTDKLGFVKK